MRHVSLLIIFFVTLLSLTTTGEAFLLYTVPVEVPVRTADIPWPDHVPGAGGDLFAQAVVHYKQGNYDAALTRFTELINRYQKSEAAAAATLYVGSIHFKRAVQGEKRDSKLLMKALESFQENVRNSPDPKNTPVVLLEIGRVYRELNLMEESKGSFKRVIKEYPLTPYVSEAQYQLALTYEREGAYHEALSEYKILYVKYPGEMEERSLFGMGKAFFALHEFGEAKKYYEAGLKRWPAYVKGHPEILIKYGECQYQNGEFSKAREGFLTFYNLYPTNQEAGFALNRVGDTYMLERKGTIAENIYLSVLVLFPKSEDAFASKLALGDITFSAVSRNLFHEDALKYYQDVEESSANESYRLTASYGIGRVLEAQGKYQKSLHIYSELLDKTGGPLNKEISHSFHSLTAKIGKDIEEKLNHNDYFGAVKDYHTYYKNFIDRLLDEELLMKIAEAHQRLLLYDEASYIYQKIVSKNRMKKELALFKAGELYSSTGDDRRAVETLARYIADYPNGEGGVSARVLLGEGFYNLMEYEKAANHFYAVMREAPYRYPSVYIKLSNILMRSGQYEESAHLLRDMIKHLPPGREDVLLSQAYIALGTAFYGLKQYKDALDAYHTGLNNKDLKEESEMVQFMVGNCLLKLNKKGEAQKIFSELSEKSAGVIKHFSEERLKDIALNLSL